MNDKKPFKDTTLGKIILGILPGALKGASKVLPDGGVLSVLGSLIDNDDSLTEDEKKEAHDQLVELYKLEVADRDSARDRESRVKEAGGKDIMMTITGIVGLGSFMFVVYAVVFMPEMVNNDLFIHLLGMIEGVVVGNIFAYYYGTSSKKE